MSLLVVDFKFTFWGLVGACVWVVNGTVAIVAVQKCGLSTAQTLWSGLSVFVGFLWGVIVFEENVRDVVGAAWALVVMSAGMGSMGMVMSQSSSGGSGTSRNRGESGYENGSRSGSSRSSSVSPIDSVEGNKYDVEMNSSSREFAAARERLMMGTTTTTTTTTTMNTGREFDDLSKSTNPFGFRTRSSSNHSSSSSSALEKQKDVKIGILCATYVGIANGSFMTPLKYANKEVTGLEYLFSFGVGSAIATVVLVFLYNVYRRQIKRDFSPLNFHFETCAKPALLTGLLWSAGNACSIVAISKLGVAIGWPLVQCQLVVSTSWGVWYYREVRGRKAIAGFFASALFVLFGVIMLGNSSR
tara:strand:+ start:150 stop:1223 length:1074 start_codon:yes stop_codon:yes gene_type:complete